MTDQGLFTLFLFLHVGAAIIAFGPTFIYMIIGGMGAAEPMHANFAVRVTSTINDRVVIPLALTMPVTGFLMVYFGHIDLTNRAWYWLDLAIVIYVVLVIISIGIQRPTVQRMIQLTTRPPAAAGAPAVAGAPAAGGAPAAAGAPAGRRAPRGPSAGRSAARSPSNGRPDPAQRDGPGTPARCDDLPDGRQAAVLSPAAGRGSLPAPGAALEDPARAAGPRVPSTGSGRSKP